MIDEHVLVEAIEEILGLVDLIQFLFGYQLVEFSSIAHLVGHLQLVRDHHIVATKLLDLYQEQSLLRALDPELCSQLVLGCLLQLWAQLERSRRWLLSLVHFADTYTKQIKIVNLILVYS